MRRRVPVTEGQRGVPVELSRFVLADWRDEQEEAGPRPSHVAAEDWPLILRIRSYQRFLAARRRFEAETGVHIRRSWERDPE